MFLNSCPQSGQTGTSFRSSLLQDGQRLQNAGFVTTRSAKGLGSCLAMHESVEDRQPRSLLGCPTTQSLTRTSESSR